MLSSLAAEFFCSNHAIHQLKVTKDGPKGTNAHDNFASDSYDAEVVLESQRKSQLQGCFHRIVLSTHGAASQTAPIYETDPECALTLTLAEAERLWAGKHHVLLQEFGDMLAAQENRWRKPLWA